MNPLPDVTPDRRALYGHPYDDFSRIAQQLNALGFCRRNPGSEETRDLVPEDWPIIMICCKLSREANAHVVDNVVDIKGYAETLAMVHERMDQQKTA